MTPVDIAEIANEVNRAYCASHGDTSPKPWKETSIGIRDSMVNGVHFHMQNPDAKPQDSHNSWLAEKRREGGWSYGEKKDLVAKTHPCFLPYEQLPESQQAKNFIFCALVKSLIPHLSRPGVGG